MKAARVRATRDRLVPAALGVIAGAAGYALADHCAERMADHRGFFLVAAGDAVRTPIRERPRRAVVAVVDGLRLDAALAMRATQRVRAAGRCVRTTVGLPSVSRPSYAVISTGLEQDRTGVRNNDETSPVAAESLWEVAREAGLRVEGRSELTWWREMFPRGFDGYTVRAPRESLFAAPLTADLTLVHPVYPDDAAHDHGAASRRYRDAVARVDGELSGLLATLDLRRDLVVFTADHGHRDAGGHGGDAPEVLAVLTCFAGRGVARGGDDLASDTRALAPTVATLLGLRLPRHLRAVEDPLDLVARVVDRDAVGAGYLDGRLRAIDAARAQNRRQLRAWTGGAGTWTALYARRRRVQWLRGALAGAALAAAAAAFARRALPRGERARAGAWALGVGACYVGAYAAFAGGLDVSSLNRRDQFVHNTIAAAVCAIAAGVLAHFALRRRFEGLRERAWLLLALAIAANALHVVTYGWPMGFPLPGPRVYYAAFLAAAFQVVAGAFAALASLAGARNAAADADVAAP